MNRNSSPFIIRALTISTLTIFTACLIFASSASASGPAEKVIYRFIGGSDGSDPMAGLVADHAGNLYGATSSGGNSACQGGCGTLFELTPNLDGNWTETQLHSFTGGSDGAFPETNLIFDQAGNLYGTTLHGGASDDGTVFRLSPPPAPGNPWTETVLYNFVGDRDGYYCFGGLVFDPAGNLYGAGFFGGRYGGGTIFQLVPPIEGDAWSLNVLHSFQGVHDGLDPYGALILDTQSSIYGATHDGKVFKLKPPSSGHTNWTLQIIYSSSSQFSVGALLAGKQGALFGTSTFGGSANRGTVFQLTPPTQGSHSWTVSTLYQFAGATDGELPLNGLIADRYGNLYGTTEGGGAFNAGTVFKLSPSTQGQPWTETLLHNFAGGSDGAGPGAGLIFGKQGALYGTTQSGGSNNNGTAFKVVP